MEPAYANLARSHIPVSPIGSNGRGSSTSLLQGNVTARSCLPPAPANHVCSVQNFIHALELNQGLHSRSVSHVEIGWHERLELKEFQGHVVARRKAPPTNVGCSRSLFENLERYWFRDQPRFGSSQSSSFGSSSPASTSREFHRRRFTWGLKKKSQMRNCRCGLDELSDDENEVEGEGKYDVSSDVSSEERTNVGAPGPGSDQAAGRADTLESELFIYTGQMRALENFRAEVAKADEEINLLRAATFVAQHLYPRITADEVEADMAEMAVELEPLLPPPAEQYTMRIINTINKYLFERLGYKGATNYLDPGNSCINMVLKRREGLPLTMSLVYMELAKRVGLPMQGGTGRVIRFIAEWKPAEIKLIEDAC